MVLHAHVLLAAKAATDEHAVAMHFFFWNAQHGCDFVLFVIDALSAAVEQNAILAFRKGDGALWFQKCMIVEWGVVFFCDDNISNYESPHPRRRA